jgi:hypothetical protein
MSKYGTIPASTTTTPPAPPAGSSTAPDSTTSRVALRPWRELTDPRSLSVPTGRSDVRRRARANLASFGANYKLAFLAVVSVSLLWQWRRWRSIWLPVLFLCACFSNLSGKFFPLLLIFALFQLMTTGAAASVLVSVPVGLLLVGGHAVLHCCPAEDGADGDGEALGIIAPRETPTAVNEPA